MHTSIVRGPAFTLAAIVVVGMAATSQQAAQGVGVVNLQRVMPETPGYQQAQATFEAEFLPVSQELQARVLRRDSLIADYDETSTLLAEADRQARETEIQELVAEITRDAAAMQNNQTARERELMAPIELRVQSILEGVRAELNLAIVFDVASTPGLAAVDVAIDLSAIVIQRLQ